MDDIKQFCDGMKFSITRNSFEVITLIADIYSYYIQSFGIVVFTIPSAHLRPL